MTSKHKALLAFLVCVVAVLWFRLSVKAENLLGADHGGKYIQAASLLKNGFRSERVIYLAEQFDPEYRYCPLGLFKNGKDFISPFPVSLAAVSALLIPLGGPAAVYWASAFSLMGIFALLFFWDKTGFLSIFVLLFSSFPSIAFLFLDVNLYLLFLLSGMTLYHFSRARSKALTAGILCGLAVIFRLEGILFLSLFVFFRGLADWRGQRGTIDTGLRRMTRLAYFVVGMALILASLVFFNEVRYGTLLGPRFSANEGGFFANLETRMGNAVVLLLAGRARIGFFAFMPFFAIALILWAFRSETVRGLSLSIRVLVQSSAAFLILGTLLSPNDSNIDLGSRYLVSAVVPMALLSREIILSRVHMSKRARRLLTFGLIASLCISLFVQYVALRTTRKSAQLIGRFQTELHKYNADFLILQDPVAMNLIGLDYLEKPVMLLRTTEDLKVILPVLKDHGVVRPLLLLSRPPELPAGLSERDRRTFLSMYLPETSRREYLQTMSISYPAALLGHSDDIEIYGTLSQENPSLPDR